MFYLEPYATWIPLFLDEILHVVELIKKVSAFTGKLDLERSYLEFW